ncbi:MAG: Crp/Fnr family transcriptional regulator [Lachnospiraceae bacterium]|uniref:Crp/Fnr family transcriptional regulator n=1 Tax=Candidatus Weimeria bifida TaxID=2599074 RepID=A0A6N7J358_9FIRM|nr:Crp/Fnr family transcriptional regulator [Candidatus Weimeria bifida]RRF96189.1 MAG: Crp/Fnr family transcriptional regulator [Lachnospiraceae bacterium]
MEEKDLSELKHARIFNKISEQQIQALMGCVRGEIRTFPKDSIVLPAGEKTDSIGVLMEGKLQVESVDYWGNTAVMRLISPGEIFGEAYAASDSEPMPNDVVSLTDCRILFMNMHRMLTECQQACTFHNQLIQNLFKIATRRNRYMNRKISHMSKRTTREKLLSYLSDIAKQNDSNHFTIPFDRQQLADYLSVERSAMSAELSRMAKDGLIKYHKNEFTLLDEK